MFRVDHGFTPNFRMSHSFYWNHRPSIRNCGEVGGCTYRVRSAKPSPEKNTDYYGNGFYQRISTHHAHQQFDWIIQQQPAEPHHGRLRPLVHGRQPPVGRRGLAAAAVGGTPAPTGGILDTTRARRRLTSPATSPTTPIGQTAGRSSGTW